MKTALLSLPFYLAPVVIGLLLAFTSVMLADPNEATLPANEGPSGRPEPLTIVTNGIPPIVVGMPSLEIVRFEASGGTPPYQWGLDISKGLLPTGTRLEVATGILSGMVQEATDKPYHVTITVTDSAGAIATKAFTFPVEGREVIPWYGWIGLLLPGVLILIVAIKLGRSRTAASVGAASVT